MPAIMQLKTIETIVHLENMSSTNQWYIYPRVGQFQGKYGYVMIPVDRIVWVSSDKDIPLNSPRFSDGEQPESWISG